MGAGLDLHGRRKAGTEFPVDISLALIATESGTIVVAAIRDLTERRREQAAQAHLAAIVESTNDAVAATDLAGIVSSWNPGAERLLGFSAAEMIGRSIFTVVDDAFTAPMAAARERVGAGEQVGPFGTRRGDTDGQVGNAAGGERGG